MKKHLALTLIGILLLQGCVIKVNSDDWDEENSSWHRAQERNARLIQQLELGRSQASVESEFGEADLTESFKRDEDRFTVLFYRTQHRHSDGKTTKDETTPLVFIDGELVGWGETAIENATK